MTNVLYCTSTLYPKDLETLKDVGMKQNSVDTGERDFPFYSNY